MFTVTFKIYSVKSLCSLSSSVWRESARAAASPARWAKREHAADHRASSHDSLGEQWERQVPRRGSSLTIYLCFFLNHLFSSVFCVRRCTPPVGRVTTSERSAGGHPACGHGPEQTDGGKERVKLHQGENDSLIRSRRADLKTFLQDTSFMFAIVIISGFPISVCLPPSAILSQCLVWARGF